MKKDVKTYLKIIGFCWLAAILLVPVSYGARLLYSLSGCASFYGPDIFAAGCANSLFDDYEHQAFYFDLEPQATESLRAAEVIFLGDSRTQHAFSTQSLVSFFEERGQSYYLAGFGQNEMDLFPAELFERLDLKPRAIIINASPFFKGFESGIAQEVSRHPVKMYWQGVVKRAAYKMHRAICVGSSWTFPMCLGVKPAVYRGASNGFWYAVNFEQDLQPVSLPEKGQTVAAVDPVQLGHARDFLASVKVENPACVILTAVPSPDARPEEVAALAAALGVSFVSPSEVRELNLKTFDGVHLEGKSAESWSWAFLNAAKPLLESCGRINN